MILVLTSCAHVTPKPNNYSQTNTGDQNQLLDLHQSSNNKSKTPKNLNAIRLDGLKEVAMALGAQGALAARSTQINTMLTDHHGELDQVYNFQNLMLQHNVLPPVLAEGQRTLNKNDNNTVRLADKTYRIVQQAKFATAPPNWRNYLMLSYEKPELPEYTLLPRDDSMAELEAWKKGVNQGWSEGSKQANQIFSTNLARLQRDYNGMVLYRRLVNYQMITAPHVAETKLGITGGGDEMSINDRFKRITQAPGLVADSDEWRPAIAQAFTQVAKPAPHAAPPAKIVPDMKPLSEAKMEPSPCDTCDVDPSTYVK